MVDLQRFAAHAFSLVVLLSVTCAHAWKYATSHAGLHLRALENVKDTTVDVKDTSTAIESVVQDWKLVCEELCRAGLGGPPCGPQCNEIAVAYESERKEAAQYLLGANEEDLCTILCVLDLGEYSCSCHVRTDILKDRLNGDTVCKAFCLLENYTVAGCSLCQITTDDNSLSSTTTPLPVTKVEHTAIAREQPSQPSIVAAPQTDGALEDISKTSTTPDWNEVCLSLCKIGEGGSLCNCDLPPFF